MTKNNSDVFMKVLNALKTDGSILDQLLPKSDEVMFSSSKVIEIMEASYPLVYNEDEDVLTYVNEDGVTFVAPDLSAGVSVSSEWLSDKLPIPILDFEQGGNIRQQDEARAIYKLICIGIIFSDFKKEISDTFREYDFDSFCFKKIDYEYVSMVSFLNSFIDSSSVRMNVVVSSANIVISNSIEKKDSYWKSQLSLDEITEFARISRDVKNIIISYEREEKLNPNEMNKLTRIEKLKKISQRDLEIDEVIDASECRVLYRISKFNSERLKPTVKRKIFTAAKKISYEVVKNEKRTGRDADERFAILYSQYFRQFTKMAVTTLRTNEISKYKRDRVNYKFIKKV